MHSQFATPCTPPPVLPSYEHFALRRSDMNRLKNKVAVITGGGAGIGRATCELFAEEGATVVVAERDEATGREVEQGIIGRGGRALFVRTDVADEASIQAMVTASDKAFGRIDILVINAA